MGLMDIRVKVSKGCGLAARTSILTITTPQSGIMTVPREERTQLLRRNTKNTYRLISESGEKRQKNIGGFAGSNK